MGADIYNCIGKVFWRFGLPAGLSGYYYAKEGIAYVIENNCFCSKVLLTHVAQKYNTDHQNIERCIRTLIDKSWNRLESIGMFSHRPSCREFILKCAEYISLNMVSVANAEKAGLPETPIEYILSPELNHI